MELYEAPITGSATVHLPWSAAVIRPVGDVQLGAEGCAESTFRRDFQEALDMGAHFVGMGDYLDFSRPTMRKLFHELMHEDDTSRKVLDDAVKRSVERFLRLVKGSEGRWLWLLEGHHYHEFVDGTTSDMMIAKALGAPFLGTCAVVRLGFKRRTEKYEITESVEVWSHHGEGGAQTIGGIMARPERMAACWPMIRLFLVAHYHRLFHIKFPRLITTWGKTKTILDKPRSIVLTGGYLQGYAINSQIRGRPGGNYVEKRMLPPTAIGASTVFLTPRHGTHGENVDIKVLT